MISTRSMNAAKKYAAYEKLGPPEQLPFFMNALKDPYCYWILRNGKWRPRHDGWKVERQKDKQNEVDFHADN